MENKTLKIIRGIRISVLRAETNGLVNHNVRSEARDVIYWPVISAGSNALGQGVLEELWEATKHGK